MTTVVETTEEGKRIFKKIQESPDEQIFFSSEYFAKIGFPDADVDLRKVSPEGIMKGGGYKNVKNLTQPFRTFVKFVQGTESLFNRNTEYVESTQPQSEVAVETSDKPGFFERMSNYNNQIFKYVKESVDKLRKPSVGANKNVENKASEEPVNVDKSTILDNINISTPNLVTNPTQIEPVKGDIFSTISEYGAESASTIESDSSTEGKKYWVVSIPIIDDEIVPYGKYEKAEAKLDQILREEKVDRSLGKSKVGEMHEVGNRFVRICESVKEFEPYQLDDIQLPGSRMHKFKSVRNG
jgi:hypothetical protein